MLDLFPLPTIFAHRGASNYAPENTLAAFELALRQGADAIELDAQLCADGEVVIIHDHSVDRTTDGVGKVSLLTLSTLKQLDAGSFFDRAFQGERIPTLNEVFEALGKQILVNIELKNNASPLDKLPEKVAQIVLQHQMEERVIFSSFNPVAVMKIKRLLPQTACGLLILPGLPGSLERVIIPWFVRFESLNPALSSVTTGMIRKEHAARRRVFAYTATQAEDIRRLFELGVDGLFTDDPPLALQVLAEKRKTGLGQSDTPNRSDA